MENKYFWGNIPHQERLEKLADFAYDCKSLEEFSTSLK